MDALYIAASGMIAQNQSMAAIGANLANADSPGYLTQVGSMAEFPSAMVTRVGGGSSPQTIGTSGQGVAFLAGLELAPSGQQTTGLMTDLAIGGSGFFAVRNGAGGVLYTRDGHFTVDSTGTLVTSGGDRVLMTNGQPVVVGEAPFTVSANGTITQQGKVLGQLALFTLPAQGPITTLPGNLYQTAGAVAAKSIVTQGALNTSNVNLATQSVDLITAESSYQSLTEVVNEESNRLNTAASLGVLA